MAVVEKSWPPSSGLSTPTVLRGNAVFALHASIEIDAPAFLVMSIVRDTSTYEKWNTWIPRATIHSQPPSATTDNSSVLNLDTSFTYHVIMNAAKPTSETPTQLRVTDLSSPEAPSTYISVQALESDPSFTADLSKVWRIAWKGEGGFTARGLRTERFHEIIELDDGNRCEVRTWEVMGGILAHTVKWLYRSTLEEKFEVWCRELKEYAEAQARAGATNEDEA